MGAPSNAGPGAAHTPPPGLQARPMAGQGPCHAPPPRGAVQDPSCEVAPPGRAVGRLPDPVAPGHRWQRPQLGPWRSAIDPGSLSRTAATTRTAKTTTPPQSPEKTRAHAASSGRAGGILLEQAVLKAVTAHALTAPAGTHDLANGASDDADAQDDRAAASEPDGVQSVLAPPGRAGGMLTYLPSVGPAPSAVQCQPR
ncbi:hypothetical protein PI126_g23319 [Phytophthora idaei]|nr:hypothetical protein PI126_g23319 [Phytophthora idaei]